MNMADDTGFPQVLIARPHRSLHPRSPLQPTNCDRRRRRFCLCRRNRPANAPHPTPCRRINVPCHPQQIRDVDERAQLREMGTGRWDKMAGLSGRVRALVVCPLCKGIQALAEV